MSRTRRTYQIITAATVIAAWAALYLVVVANSEPPPPPTSAAKVNRELAVILAVPMLLWVVAALLLLHHWWSQAGSRLSAMDPPGRLLAAAVATLPDHRRGWGAAMVAELAEVRGRRDRWRFALSCVRAAVWPPRSGGWPVLALVTGVVVAAITAAGQAVGAAMPAMNVFATSFVAIVGAAVILTVARSRRPRLPVPGPTLLVCGGVAAAIAMTVTFLRQQPTAAEHLPPAAAVFLAAVLAGCLWVAVAPPRPLATNRVAPHLGVGAALVFVAGLLPLIHAGSDPRLKPGAQQVYQVMALNWLVFGSATMFAVAAFAAGAIGRSFRHGVQAGAWTAIASLPLAYALWLTEALRRYTIEGGLLLDGDPGPVGANLGDARFWILGVIPLLGLPVAVIGAAVGALFTRPAVTQL